MAHGLNSIINRGSATVRCKNDGKSGIGSRRIFAPHFKLQVLDSYRNDADCKGNQRATARKYGIHRRQIQKWLQCENNLRNSVGKCKALSPEARKCGVEVSLRSGQHRQRDDLCADAYSQNLPVHDLQVAPAEAYNQTSHIKDTLVTDAYSQSAPEHDTRVPSLTDEFVSGTPLDYSIHSLGHLVPPKDLGITPIDLSLKRSSSSEDPHIPLCCPLTTPLQYSPRIPLPYSKSPTFKSHPDVWDLSLRGHKRNYEEVTPPSPPTSSPVPECQSKPVKLFKPYLLDDSDLEEEKPKAVQIVPPCCNGFVSSTLPENEVHFYNNNNNNNNNHILPDYSYTFHELQPKTTFDYYYTINKNYIYSSDYDGMSICSSYDNANLLQHPSPPLKQRQSYSLDFKLSAIECYYQDSICRGNQRAVATKYNIHRRQVQKWLKQEEELRTRNDSTKQMSIVR